MTEARDRGTGTNAHLSLKDTSFLQNVYIFTVCGLVKGIIGISCLWGVILNSTQGKFLPYRPLGGDIFQDAISTQQGFQPNQRVLSGLLCRGAVCWGCSVKYYDQGKDHIRFLFANHCRNFQCCSRNQREKAAQSRWGFRACLIEHKLARGLGTFPLGGGEVMWDRGEENVIAGRDVTALSHTLRQKQHL